MNNAFSESILLGRVYERVIQDMQPSFEMYGESICLTDSQGNILKTSSNFHLPHDLKNIFALLEPEYQATINNILNRISPGKPAEIQIVHEGQNYIISIAFYPIQNVGEDLLLIRIKEGVTEETYKELEDSRTRFLYFLFKNALEIIKDPDGTQIYGEFFEVIGEDFTNLLEIIIIDSETLKSTTIRGNQIEKSHIDLSEILKTRSNSAIIIRKGDEFEFHTKFENYIFLYTISSLVGKENIVSTLMQRYSEQFITLLKLGSLVKAVKDYQSFIDYMMHELKNSMSVIQLSSDLTKKKLDRKLPWEEHMQVMRRAIAEVENKFNALLLFNQVSTHDVQIEDRVDILGIIKHQVKVAKNSILTSMEDDRKFEIKLDIISELDGIQLRSINGAWETIIFNLLSNAIKYSDQGGTININLCIIYNRLCLQVSDEGIGIPNNELSKILDTNLFYRASNAEKTKITGHGIGFTLIIKFIKAHGGEITVRENPHSQKGPGTVVTASIPLDFIIRDSEG